MNNLSRISDACYINLNNDQPGIVGLFGQDPETAKYMSMLAQHLLKGEHELPIWFRELIAAYVSKTNNCNFCYNSHKQIAFASALSVDEVNIIKDVLEYNSSCNLSPKQYYLLVIAGAVTNDVQGVSKEMIEDATKEGATEAEILRTVQIAAAFNMYNRYVDGLGTIPGTAEYYAEAGAQIAENGYIQNTKSDIVLDEQEEYLD